MSAFRASSAARSAFRATPRVSYMKPEFQPHVGNLLYVIARKEQV